jgi:hypothetical protein
MAAQKDGAEIVAQKDGVSSISISSSKPHVLTRKSLNCERKTNNTHPD